jgi:hypothetical protein
VNPRRLHPFSFLRRNGWITVGLWVLVLYLLALYAAIRWGHPSPERHPGSD